ncbi:uncharacterized protein RJT20DRAFT_89613 [Scheffersomyces xylosifermentans]|uniref:uncharacterized protein n=1 Tax=Scheffersomyces xylosifermentans TaxID=1304137 RepID=UPI00315DAFB3
MDDGSETESVGKFFSVQINDYDTYQALPSKLDQLYSHVTQVPLIRIYGKIEPENSLNTYSSVFQVLVHVHNFYPYLYVDCFESDTKKLASKSHIDRVINYLEASLAASFKRRKARGDDDEAEAETASPETDDYSKAGKIQRKYIAGVSICKGTPIYGFQLGHKLFYRISLLSPLYKTRLAKMLYEKTVDFNTFLDTGHGNKPSKRLHLIYEAHIPYLLQFLTNFNLFGCGWLQIDKSRTLEGTNINSRKGLYFRTPILSASHVSSYTTDQIDGLSRYLSNFIDSENVLYSNPADVDNFTKFSRMGRSMLEIDITTNSIVNRDFVTVRELHNDFSELREFKKLLASSSHHPHNGYKYDLQGKQRIYLSSLEHVYNDLKYQCKIRNSSFEVDDQALSISQKSQATTQAKSDSYLGMGQTEWSNHSDLEDLLSYIIKLNETTNLNFEAYSKKHFQGRKINSIVKMVTTAGIDEEHPVFMSCFEYLDLAKRTPHHEFPLRYDIELMTQNRTQKTSNTQHANPHNSSLQIPSSFDDFTFSDLDQSSISNPKEDIDLYSGNNSYEVLVPNDIGKATISNTINDYGIMKINYTNPFYNKEADIPAKPLIFANKKIPIPLVNDKEITVLPISKMIEESLSFQVSELKADPFVDEPRFSKWQYLPTPPTNADIKVWLKDEEKKIRKKAEKFKSQIEPGVSQSKDFKFSYNSEKIKRSEDGFNKLSDFHLEIHCNVSDPKFSADPMKDAVSIILYHFDDSNGMFAHSNNTSGILIYNDGNYDEKLLTKAVNFLDERTQIEIFDNEVLMVNRLVNIVEVFDPDILSGYEINALSWGYIIERFRSVYDVNLLADFSRGRYKTNGKFGDRWGYTHTSNIKISGRHLINVWRLLRHEMSLTSYSLENVSYHLLHQSLPKYSNFQLSQWLRSSKFSEVLVVFRYYIRKISLILKIIEVQELITRNVEHSRLIGIDFNSNFYRGSQYRIESILSRLAKSENLLLNSPSKQQVFEMKPIECIPLIMEPDSNFYKSPLVVLDFQSLYPSVMIAYNYCFSTLVGRLHNFKPNKNDFGYLKSHYLPPGLIDLINKEGGITLSPNGYVFVKSSIRKSILAKMLEEILNIRIKVKEVMKLFRDDKELTRLYNARQLALKLIANVTYGYTSATFSGRMPNPDVSDAIVSTGREILSKSIDIINNGDYGARVVYGDTDSLFVYFPGKSKDDAFRIGRQIAQDITDQFPDPIKLKFEKVYHPCVLLTKKRYVGYSYEYESQTEPKFDAKGIETVRRDGIPAQQKIVEKSLRILFETKNLSKVKEYVLKQFYKISVNKISINDFCFAKEVRYGTYKNEAYLPPGAIVANKKVEEDHRKEPQYKQRVPYVVIMDPTKTRIKDRCMSPEDFMKSYKTPNPYSLDYDYYITRVLIPPLERIFNLMGVDVKAWYRELPKFKNLQNKNNRTTANGVLNISNNIKSHSCLNCGENLSEFSPSKYICTDCKQQELELMTNLAMEQKVNEAKVLSMERLCERCVNRNFEGVGLYMDNSPSDDCVNNDCSVYYNKFKAKNMRLQLQEKSNRIFDDLHW